MKSPKAEDFNVSMAENELPVFVITAASPRVSSIWQRPEGKDKVSFRTAEEISLSQDTEGWGTLTVNERYSTMMC